MGGSSKPVNRLDNIFNKSMNPEEVDVNGKKLAG
jgi:hypothetical protein